MQKTFQIEILQKAIDETLKPYKRLLAPNGIRDIMFGQYEPPRLTYDKAYTARADIPVYYCDTNIGNMAIIVFQPGDGTGDKSRYHLEDLVIPEEYRFQEKGERVLPRDKKNIYVEIAFPLCTIRNSKIFPYLMSLEQLTIDNPQRPRTIKKAWYLGMQIQEYLNIIYANIRGTPFIQLTTWKEDGKQHGDPHAIYCQRVRESEYGLQVVGFFTIKHPEHPLKEHLLKIAHKPQER